MGFLSSTDQADLIEALRIHQNQESLNKRKEENDTKLGRLLSRKKTVRVTIGDTILTVSLSKETDLINVHVSDLDGNIQPPHLPKPLPEFS